MLLAGAPTPAGDCGPAVAGSLALLTLLSQFKFDKLWMTIDFVDVMIVDRDTVAFLLAIFPSLRWWTLSIAVVTISVIVFLWRRDRSRMSRTCEPGRTS